MAHDQTNGINYVERISLTIPSYMVTYFRVRQMDPFVFNKEAFAARLVYARKLRGLNQKEVAKLTGIHRVNISQYECAKVLPGIEYLAMLVELYHVSYDFVFGLTESPYPPK